MGGCEEAGGEWVANMVYHTYLTASASGVLYLGVTGELERRVVQHKKGMTPGFSSPYKNWFTLTRLGIGGDRSREAD